MSKLYANETGRVIPTLCEEVTRFRRVKTSLRLPAELSDGTLYLLGRPYRSENNPLHLRINGKILPTINTGDVAWYKWYSVSVPQKLLRPGPNTVELWSEATAMDGWSIAIEAGHSRPESRLSDDGGIHWRNHSMSYLNVLRGEYVVRLRLETKQDPRPPAMIWENPGNPRMEALRSALPARVKRPGTQLERVRVLSAWFALQWEHTSSARATQYAPWDTETILAWGRTKRGHHNQRAIVFCVHYAVAFVSACQALGFSARCAVLMNEANGTGGHFVAEVWFPEYKKWVMVDPNCDALFFKDGIPLSLSEIRRLGSDLTPYVSWGKGAVFQRTFPHMAEFIRENLLKGLCFTHRSVWRRTDFLSHPEYTPPGHGSLSYCETDLVWEMGDLAAGFGMFRYFAPPAYFDRSPPDR